MAPAAGQDVPDRSRRWSHHRRQRVERYLRQRQAVQAVDRLGAHQARRTQGGTGRGQVKPSAARPSAIVWLYAGRPEIPAVADGRGRRGGDWFDGQRLATNQKNKQKQTAV